MAFPDPKSLQQHGLDLGSLVHAFGAIVAVASLGVQVAATLLFFVYSAMTKSWCTKHFCFGEILSLNRLVLRLNPHSGCCSHPYINICKPHIYIYMYVHICIYIIYVYIYTYVYLCAPTACAGDSRAQKGR